MMYANINIRVLFAVFCLSFLPLQWVQAGVYYPDLKHQPFNMTQNKSNWQKLDLSEGQTRSKVEHALVNYLLGHTIDQYLDLGADDKQAKKSSKRLKLRVNEHHLVLVYQFNF